MVLAGTYFGLAEMYPEHFVHPKLVFRKTSSAIKAHAMKYQTIASLFSKPEAVKDTGVLRLAVVFQAMGDVTPPERFTYEAFSYSEGIAQITNGGIRQMFDRGVSLRERYIDVPKVHGGFLQSEWRGPEADDVYVRTIMRDDAQDSANSYLLGLFPPLDTKGFVFGEDHSKRELMVGQHSNCTCRPAKTRAVKQRKKKSFVTINSKSTDKPCLATCLGLSFDGEPVHPSGVQDVPVDTPLDLSGDWLLLQPSVCKKPMSELSRAERTDLGWLEQEKLHAALLRDLRKLAGCSDRDRVQKYAQNCMLCEASSTKTCSSLKLGDIPRMLRNLKAADKFSKPYPKWFDRERAGKEMAQLSDWIWYSRFKPEEGGTQHAGLLLGEIINRIERAVDGETKERLAIFVVPLETLTNLYIGLNMKNPTPPKPLEELVIEVRQATAEDIDKARKSADGWQSALTGGEGSWMVRILRNGHSVHLHGCPGGYCSVSKLRRALAPRTLDPEGSVQEIRDACLGSLAKPPSIAEQTGEIVIGL
uniref:Uncharacterized protein n=1 Tax=Tetraselmis sp. GSL018 TaxID=582737 RepID=A0A061SH63_9CHLO|eukprot:CAMPEP_0177588482 /NCGR_PEP_ID=MMETSP0419_2-20121207/6248_1 /TAXON_ID=582737 /ORGANISM="Tetraselmis sp., Strain GSL018" /LENGTH=530 /DNA_ID=CAMNT_0019078681 /DNA_START=374 /DNA_END=1966 /DNA_ORIENTATION=-